MYVQWYNDDIAYHIDKVNVYEDFNFSVYINN